MQYFHFLLPIISGILFWFTGMYMKKNPPKDKKASYGYKTEGSMKSQKRWDFAQSYAAEKIQFWSFALIFMAIPMYFSHWSETTNMWVSIGLVFLFLCIPVFQTESALEEKFGDKGTGK